MEHAKQIARSQDVKQWEGVQYDIHDKIWLLLSKNLDTIDTIDIAVQSIEKMWGLCDFRFSLAKHAITIALSVCSIIESPVARKTRGFISVAEQRINRCIALARMRKEKYPDDTRNPLIDQSLGKVAERFIKATSAFET